MNNSNVTIKPEQQESEYITAEQARELGAGNALYKLHGDWVPCDGVHYHDIFKYRTTSNHSLSQSPR